ncbi:MAG: ubiquinone/menaquinone biosynthesis C-methylase UbiE [Verrucomicrobiales bacterium]|jgi:ubiquinone/menaquinone biosynthesis C-methylase UbiE
MPASTQTEDKNAEIQAFFDGWEIYRTVIDRNFMSHRELGDALVAHFANRPSGGRFLDLGCGDADMTSRVIRESRFTNYLGVDLAEIALQHARENLKTTGADVDLRQADLGEFVKTANGPFDAIVVGYSLHHFTREEKSEFFAAISDQQLLAPGGELLVYDVFCEPNETREAYLDRYLAMCGQIWDAYTERQMEMIDEHIRGRDFPEEQGEFVELARQAGLSGGDELWRDHTGFHRLIRFT